MIYTIEDLKANIGMVADKYDIKEILLFGSYFDHIPNENSDVDLLVRYGTDCRGLTRVKFMNELENQLKKEVDVINIDFAPEFITTLDLTAEGRKIYARQSNFLS